MFFLRKGLLEMGSVRDFVSGSVKILRGIAKDQHCEVCLEVRTALLLRVVAPPNGEILVSTVRGVLYELHKLGMEFGKISYDYWGSHESIQTLQRQGYDAELLSVDTTIQPYAVLKEAIYDRRPLCYYVPKLEEELFGLQYDGKKNKVDHPPRGSKDLADALAGAVYHCSLAELPGTAEAMMPRRGIVDTTEDLWEKLARGEPSTEQEFDKLRTIPNGVSKCAPSEVRDMALRIEKAFGVKMRVRRIHRLANAHA